jgi:hypothetical protein
MPAPVSLTPLDPLCRNKTLSGIDPGGVSGHRMLEFLRGWARRVSAGGITLRLPVE